MTTLFRLVLVAGWLMPLAAALAASSQPNIVVILVDDMGCGHPGSQAGTVSERTICFNGLLATFATVCVTKLPAGNEPDRFSLLPVLEGVPPADKPIRPPIVMQAGNESSMMRIRSGDWKRIAGLGSGGFSPPRSIKAKLGEPEGQLYNLRDDLAETRNLYLEKPDVVARLKAERQNIVVAGGSR